MGKILKNFPTSVVRQDTKSCRGLRRELTSARERTCGSSQLFTRMILFCGCTDIAGHIAGLLACIQPAPPRDPPPRLVRSLPALPAAPEPGEQPRPGGDTEEGPGNAGGDAGGAYREEDLEELFAAAEEDDM